MLTTNVCVVSFVLYSSKWLHLFLASPFLQERIPHAAPNRLSTLIIDTLIYVRSELVLCNSGHVWSPILPHGYHDQLGYSLFTPFFNS